MESVTRIFNCISLVWVTDIVEQQYTEWAKSRYTVYSIYNTVYLLLVHLYNDSENSNKVSHQAKVRHGVPKGSILGPLLFLLCINVLSKIINKTSAPIIFADDTNILFAHSHPIDFNKNIFIVFTTLNKWLRANQLSSKCNKTNYVHCTTKRNMSVN